MNGHGPAQPQRRRPGGAMVVTIRVVVVAITVCTLFLLSWVPMLRVAIVRRRVRDWALFWLVVVISVFWVILLGDRFAKTVWNSVGMAAAIGTGLITTSYYLWADIRHYRAAAARWDESRAGAVAGAFPSAAAPGPYAPVHPGGQPLGGHPPPPYYDGYGRIAPAVGQPTYGHLTGSHPMSGHAAVTPPAVPSGGAVPPGRFMGTVPGPAGPTSPGAPVNPGTPAPAAGAERPYRPRHARPAPAQESHPYEPAPHLPADQAQPPLTGQAPAYGYPHPLPQPQAQPQPQPPAPHPSYQPPGQPQGPQPQGPHAAHASHAPRPHHTPHQGPPAPADGVRRPQRIDQVRAELDELSDLLRRGPGHQGEREQ
ncbi:hypothetical protein [Streptomyces huiliensis]|uniref:hypothetical protein n=1 Tax=Streptomyces huiliensis TaxID=2876027 RepID=UPI001CBEE8DA|nr:hypothetical protein [Streptomyces huiliensis]MBZ4319024.1 hypothetical protein [Streptomyces huiliensis]